MPLFLILDLKSLFDLDQKTVHLLNIAIECAPEFAVRK